MNPLLLYGLSAAIILGAGALVYRMVAPRGGPARWGAAEWVAATLGVLVAVSAFTAAVVASGGDGAAPGLAAAPTADPADLGKPAPALRFRMVASGEERALDAYRGKTVLLNFWATWCAPCRAEMPDLKRLEAAYADRGLVVLVVSDEPPADILRFAAEGSLPAQSGYLTDPTTLPQPYIRMLEMRPTTFLIDAEGVIRDIIYGAGSYRSFEAALAPLLNS